MSWTAFVLVALLLIPAIEPVSWAVVVALGAAGLLTLTAPARPRTWWMRRSPDLPDLAVLAVLYLAVIGLFRLAFAGFTTGNVTGLFLAFAGGMLLGVGGPVFYNTWVRQRPLRESGLGLHALRPTLLLAVLFGGVQFVLMFWGYQLPAAADWVPLLVMSLTVGLFEAVFFRGFVQGRLEHSFGTVPAIAGAAVLYSLYHVGYGMGIDEMIFLFGLGIVYAIAYRLVSNVLVLWPLLTPIGAFFSNLEAGDIELPWASIAGFADVLVVMALLVWLGARHARRSAPQSHTTRS